MKLKTLAILTLLALNFSGVTRAAEGQSGNGGGGISRNGRYMTFYSAGFYTEPAESTSEEVPQLQELINFFNTAPYMNPLTKVAYASKLMPSAARTYYRVQANSFTPEVRARLIAEYSRVMNVDTKELALFAITDTTSQTTYLFPEFFGLTPIEQKAILFHETYWLTKPDSTYAQVVQAEMSFQAYLENPSSPDRLLNWLRTSGTNGDLMQAAAQTDLQTKAINGLLSHGGIALGSILGADFIQCRLHGERQSCKPFIQLNLYALSQKYPKSVFMRLLFDAASRNKLSFSFGNGGASDLVINGLEIEGRYINTTTDFNTDFAGSVSNALLDFRSLSYAGQAAITIPMPKGYDPIKMEIID